MSDPCTQGERLCTLEVILKSISDTLTDQKAIGVKTYEVLSEISEQGAQIKSLTMRMDFTENDVQQAFRAIRKIDLRHAHEDGAQKVEGEHKAFWDGVKQRTTPFLFPILLLVLWLADKFNVAQFFVKSFKEMKG